MADAHGSGPCESDFMQVQVLSSAPVRVFITALGFFILLNFINIQFSQDAYLLGLDSDTFYIYHVAAVMVDNLRRLLLGINLSDKAIMDFDFPGVGFPV